MELTDKGADIIKKSEREKLACAKKLISGQEDIMLYTNKAICYDAAAFVRCLLGSTKINGNSLEHKNKDYWIRLFDFNSGKKWDGKTSLPIGKAVGFYRLTGQKTFFHAAIAVTNRFEL